MGSSLLFIDEHDFLIRSASIDPSYWNGRWPYIGYVVGLLKEQSISTILELGSNNLPLAFGGHTMDIVDKPTFLWDAKKTPWPIADKAYDMFIALQVWEHLDHSQQKAFTEVVRTSRMAILSFPYRWKNGHEKDHQNIDDEKIKKWTLDIEPIHTKEVGIRKIYMWKFE